MLFNLIPWELYSQTQLLAHLLPPLSVGPQDIIETLAVNGIKTLAVNGIKALEGYGMEILLVNGVETLIGN